MVYTHVLRSFQCTGGVGRLCSGTDPTYRVTILLNQKEAIRDREGRVNSPKT